MASSGVVNPDLQKERDGSSFNPEDLHFVLAGGPEKARRRRYLTNVIRNDPEFKSEVDPQFMSREQVFEESLRRHCAIMKKISDLGLTNFEEAGMLTNIALADFNGLGPLTLHYAAFIPPIMIMGSDEQKEKWLPLCLSFKVIGCYAQTELGHGTFVRGIETRADYDPNTKEFVLSSPTVSATKWWVGTMGYCATHALVMAQLYSQGKHHGLHPFIVPLRDMDTHKTLPGIDVGDIGPKFGFNSVDNGFLRMNNVRIPKDNLLSKTGKLSDDGTYHKPDSDKIVYGGMLGIRASLPLVAARNMAKGITIAVRYSCVRRQSKLNPKEGESQVLDYQIQQHKLFPLLAAAYGLHFTAFWLKDFHSEVVEEMGNSDFSRLPEIHVLSAGLKALSNYKVHEGIELCRLSCGGHGYSMSSGLPSLYVNHVANSTAEGDSTVLYLQCARYLAKCFLDIQQGNKLDPSVAYLGKKNFGPVNAGSGDLQGLLGCFQFRTQKLLEGVGKRLEKTMIETGSQGLTLSRNSVLLVEVSKAHIEAVILNAFVAKVEDVSKSNPVLGATLGVLCEIYAIHGVLQQTGVYLENNFLTKGQIEDLTDRLFSLYDVTRRDAVALVDAFGLPEEELCSVLGRYDGQVYENLYQWAKKSPFNNEEVTRGFYKHLQNLRSASKI